MRVSIESTDGRRGEAARVGDRERVGEALGGSSNFLHATCSEKFIVKTDFKNVFNEVNDKKYAFSKSVQSFIAL